MTAKRTKVHDEEDVAGLDISNGRLIAAHFSRASDGIKLDHLAVSDYEPDLTDRQIASHIRNFWEKEKFSSRLVCTCLRSRSLVVRYFQYSNLNLNELAMALSLEAEEALQSPASDICMDWSTNPVIYNSAGEPEQLSGTLVAAPRKTVKRHLDLIQAAGLYSVNVEPSCSAAYSLYSFLFKNQQTPPACLVNLGERTADIIMCTEGGVHPRTLFSADSEWSSNTEYLLENIQNALLYYHLKVKRSAIQKVILVGKIPDIEQLPGKLARKVSLPVEILNPCASFGISVNDPASKSGCNLAAALGLALRGGGI